MPDSRSAWQNSPVTVTLSATDDLVGVDYTLFAIDGAQVQTYTAPFDVSGDGTHTVEYWSVDVVGNVESVNSEDLHIDEAELSDHLRDGARRFLLDLDEMVATRERILREASRLFAAKRSLCRAIPEILTFSFFFNF